jgi:hypothetical protein
MLAVPLGFYLFLVELAAGGLLVTTLLDWEGDVGEGFLFLNGLFLVGAAGAGIWLRSVLPAQRMVEYAAGRPWLGGEVAAWCAFALCAAVQLLFVRRERRRVSRLAGGVASALGLAAMGISAAAYAGPQTGPAALYVSLLAGALALGAVWSGMMLGHWYLVTPLLSLRPLLRLNAGLAGMLVVQGALAAWALSTGLVERDVAWLSWLRVGVGIVFPLALALPIWRTARVRSTQSATGLLYVALGAVLAGEIIAKALFFVTGVPM